MPEIQTVIAYIMGKIVFASFGSIPFEREPIAAVNSWCRRWFRRHPFAPDGFANRMTKVVGC
jgi:hypothetical protein